MERPAPPGIDEIQQIEFGRLFSRFARLRMMIVPLAGTAAVALGVMAPQPWRWGVLASVVVGVSTLGVFEIIRLRRQGFLRDMLWLNVVGMSLAQLGVIFATGALESPLLPVLPPMAVVGSALLGRRPALALLTGPQLLAVVLFTFGEVGGWLPDVNLPAFGGGVRAGHNDAALWTAGLLMVCFILVATALGLLIRSALDQMLERALEARSDELSAHAAHAAELTALSGEIAHELKNPLATIKGLGALLAGDLNGRPAERLAVLRGEVDRMQGILEEFLNFSRPLVPLSLGPVELGRLVGEIAELHEGLAAGRGLRLEVESPAPVTGRCDPRKVKQILINLVQNALEASPRGGLVTLRVSQDGDQMRVEVLDRGPGLDQGSAARVFEPGVTTRDQGSGLGLTIARALARQHGGDVTLEPREGGGARAIMTLPLGEDA